MESEIEEGNIWDILPSEDACRIVSNLTNFQDILSYMQSSKRFIDLARFCVQALLSPEKIQVDIKLLRDFSKLTGTDDNITIIIRPETIGLISTLPNLQFANFRLEGGLLEEYLPLILSQLQYMGGLRIWDDQLFFLLQNSTFMFLGKSEKMDELAGTIMSLYSRLNFHDIRQELSQDVGFRAFRIMDRNMRRFLAEGDFGLMLSRNPPSGNNPPVSDWLKRLAYFGLATPNNLTRAFSLYVRYNLLAIGQVISADQLMRRCFGPAVIRSNQKRIAQGKPPITLDALRFAELSILISETGTKGVPDDPTDYDIINPIDLQDRTAIENVLLIARNEYRPQQRGVQETFYRSDGSTFTL